MERLPKDLLIEHVKIYDCNSPLDGARHNLWIREGRLHQVDPAKWPAGAVHLVGENLCISPSWCDLRAHFCDPGEEPKEDLLSGLAAAVAGGYAEVAVLPDTQPVMQTKTQIRYLLEKALPTGLKIHPMAPISINQAGERLSELRDLFDAGAVAATDGHCPLNNGYLLVQALRYLRAFDGLLMHRAEDQAFAGRGVVHEGRQSLFMGLTGIPSLAEYTQVQASLDALAYAGGRLHINCLSAKESLKLLHQARKRFSGQLSADVSLHHLRFSDSDLEGFDTQHRVSPPYRTEADCRALRRALTKGRLTVIVSDHHPQSLEGKCQPFAHAAIGNISLQLSLPILLQMTDELPLSCALAALYDGPRRVLKQPIPSIQINELLSATLFDTKATWHFDATTNRSKSSNSPFYGQKLVGHVRSVLANGHYLLAPAKEALGQQRAD